METVLMILSYSIKTENWRPTKNQDTHLELYTDLSLPTVGIDSIQTADF
jgi:hypothetical protein